jgi:hypothetical protein
MVAADSQLKGRSQLECPKHNTGAHNDNTDDPGVQLPCCLKNTPKPNFLM